MYLRLIAEGHEVRVAVSEVLAEGTMAGMVPRVGDWRSELDWVREAGDEGLILFEGVGFGVLQDELRASGLNVIGGSALGDRLEEDRAFAQELLATFGMRVTPSAEFTSIEVAVSDDDGATFGTPIVVQHVNPQGEPNGYNRGRRSILNAPYIAPESHGTDVYITYFHGKTPLQNASGVIFTGPLAKQADIYLASSHDNGATWAPVKINDDDGLTSHVFPSAQVNKNNWVYAGWTDRRVDPTFNEFTDEWATVSHDAGATFGHNVVQTDVSTTWRARADARPNFGDYNSSELLNDNQFVMTWADGRFPRGTFIPPTCTPAPPPGQTCPPRLSVTPDTLFTIANGLGTGN